MTLEEIKKAVESNPALQKQVAVWAITTADGKELLTDNAKLEADKAVKEATAELYTNIDNDLFEVLGKRKESNEKTYDFVKKLAGELKELRAKADKWTKEKKELEGKLQQKEEEYLTAQIEADLMGGLPDIDSIEDEGMKRAVSALVELEKGKRLKSAKIIEGKVVYHNEDGTPNVNKEYKPITSKEIWDDVLGSLVKKSETQTTQSGGGANSTVKEGQVVTTGEGDTATIKLVLDKSSFSTKVEFNKIAEVALRKQGVELGSKDFNNAIDAAYKEYEVDKLDLQ